MAAHAAKARATPAAPPATSAHTEIRALLDRSVRRAVGGVSGGGRGGGGAPPSTTPTRLAADSVTFVSTFSSASPGEGSTGATRALPPAGSSGGGANSLSPLATGAPAVVAAAAAAAAAAIPTPSRLAAAMAAVRLAASPRGMRRAAFARRPGSGGAAQAPAASTSPMAPPRDLMADAEHAQHAQQTQHAPPPPRLLSTDSDEDDGDHIASYTTAASSPASAAVSAADALAGAAAADLADERGLPQADADRVRRDVRAAARAAVAGGRAPVGSAAFGLALLRAVGGAHLAAGRAAGRAARAGARADAAADALAARESDLTSAQDAVREAVASQRGARDALADVSAQNARLVAALAAERGAAGRAAACAASRAAHLEARLAALEARHAHTPAAPPHRPAPSFATAAASLSEDGAASSTSSQTMASAMPGQGEEGEQDGARGPSTTTATSSARVPSQSWARRPGSGGTPRPPARPAARPPSAAAATAAARPAAPPPPPPPPLSSSFRAAAASEAAKRAGNAAFAAGRYEEATLHYTAGLVAGASVPHTINADLAAVLHCNRAAAHHAAGRFVDAIADCCAAEALDPGYARPRQRRAEAWAALGDGGAAAADLEALAREGTPGAGARLASIKAARLPGACPYGLLGVRPDAPTATIRSSYRALALRFHPDKASGLGPGGPAAAACLFGPVAAAHALLTDAGRRASHDADRARRGRDRDLARAAGDLRARWAAAAAAGRR